MLLFTQGAIMNNDTQPKTRDDWFTLIDEQQASGLSQTEFCKQRNLILCRFTYYKKIRTQSAPAGTFTPVKVRQEQSPSVGVIKIDLPNGFCCHVPSAVPADKLKSIIGALMLR
jgi:hypothetical protein